MGRLWRVLFLLVLAVLLVASAPVIYFKNYFDNPTNMASKPFLVRIERGMSVRDVARVLTSQGVIRSVFDFALVCRLMDASIPAGEYRIPPRLKPRELIRAFCPRNIALRRVTIPEGSTLKDIAAIVESSLGILESDFLMICNDESFAAHLGIRANGLEGYLYPETYYFEPGTSAQKVAERMVKEFESVIGQSYQSRIAELGSTLHEIVTIASLVEKETALERERPLIAAVLYNRLRRNMPLQIDASVIHGLRDFDGNLTRDDLKADTPYNTYIRKGLPPGPICSPSKASLLAALYPGDVGYLYFVSMNNGQHKFSATIEEHNRAVWRYQKGRRR
ncbi:MAG TPA: endolytic transglycosylase MltG [bacterium]|nr:endolytic transglycosylase MltG [bacterium]